MDYGLKCLTPSQESNPCRICCSISGERRSLSGIVTGPSQSQLRQPPESFTVTRVILRQLRQASGCVTYVRSRQLRQASGCVTCVRLRQPSGCVTCASCVSRQDIRHMRQIAPVASAVRMCQMRQIKPVTSHASYYVRCVSC